MKHCSKCVMPETTESLVFDDKDVCSVCKQIDYKQTKIDWELKEPELDNIIGEYKNIVFR